MKKIFSCMCMFFALYVLRANEKIVPLSRITLYSSGVAFFEHEGKYVDSFSVPLRFSNGEMDDILKSLVVFDEGAKKISLLYNSKANEKKLLSDIGMQNYETLFDFFNSHKGSEIEITSDAIKTVGKIVSASEMSDEAFISILSYNGIHSVPLKDVRLFRFTHADENAKLEKLTDILLKTGNSKTDSLLQIEGKGERNFSYGYTIASPVWKASYRLNLKDGEAEFQLFAIIDNESGIDWENISLTLTTGKPVGFVQNLFAPCYTVRKTVPVLIAEAAEPVMLDLAYSNRSKKSESPLRFAERKTAKGYADMAEYQESEDENENESERNDKSSVFSFTIKNFSLEKGKSIMIPIVKRKISFGGFFAFSKRTCISNNGTRIMHTISKQNDFPISGRTCDAF